MPTPHNNARRTFLRSAAMTAAASLLRRPAAWAEMSDPLDPKVTALVARTTGIDTHNHVDVPLTDADQPGPPLDLRGDLKRSGLAAICMTFATDYQPGDPYERFLHGMAAYDRVLKANRMARALTPADILQAHAQGEPTVVQAIEGAHFLQGKLDRVQEAYGRGLRHFGLLHDSDASVPLGDVYTNPPAFGGLTTFGAQVIRECNRLGMVVDLAHADTHTTAMALKVATRPVIISHTGLDTQTGNDPRMAQMMRPRLIGKEQARMVAAAGGVIGVWTHLADTPLAYAHNIRALVDVIGVDHVCIGTDTKLTTPAPHPPMPPGSGPGGPPPGAGGPPPGKGPGGPGGGRAGERTNQAWEGETAGFFYVVVQAMLQAGFTPDEIGKIGGGNYLRIFAQAVH